jgi:hypothetical protein
LAYWVPRKFPIVEVLRRIKLRLSKWNMMGADRQRS